MRSQHSEDEYEYVDARGSLQRPGCWGMDLVGKGRGMASRGRRRPGATRPRREQEALDSEPLKGRVFQERATHSAVKGSLAPVAPQASFKLPAYQGLGIFDTATFIDCGENVLPHLYFTLWLYDASVVLLVVFDDLSASLEPMFVLLA